MVDRRGMLVTNEAHSGAEPAGGALRGGSAAPTTGGMAMSTLPTRIVTPAICSSTEA